MEVGTPMTFVNDGGEVLAAIVTKVHSEDCVNLGFFTEAGTWTRVSSVPVRASGGFRCWPAPAGLEETAPAMTLDPQPPVPGEGK